MHATITMTFGMIQIACTKGAGHVQLLAGAAFIVRWNGMKVMPPM